MQRVVPAVIEFAASSSLAVFPAVAVLLKGALNLMLLKTHKCVAVFAGSVLVLAGLHLPGIGCPGARVLSLVGRAAQPSPTALADDKKDDKDKRALSGDWVRKEGELKLEFGDKNVLKISPHGKDDVILILCECTLDKDGRVKVKITDFEGKEEVKEKVKEKLPIGTEFSFKWKVKDDTATLDGLKGDKVDLLKSHLEGEYSKKK